MKYLLDTNICTYIINNKPPQVTQYFQRCNFGDIGISSITVAELNYGIEKSKQRDRNRAALEQFLAPLTVLPFDHAASDRYGELRQHLERIGQPIGPMDMLIAAHALSLNVIVVTNNVREFQRVPKLMIENWV